ncbi:MAG TPA: hypothetical protein VFN53_06530 [Acidobacteriaceae bacterium]|nr:hypothetical protein [Acidobacteriaceae bacterium]
MQTKDGKPYTIPDDLLKAIRETYPKIDVDAELKKAALWLMASPSRRKTRSGMPRFLVSWMNRAAPSGIGETPPASRNGPQTSRALDEILALELHRKQHPEEYTSLAAIFDARIGQGTAR